MSRAAGHPQGLQSIVTNMFAISYPHTKDPKYIGPNADKLADAMSKMALKAGITKVEAEIKDDLAISTRTSGSSSCINDTSSGPPGSAPRAQTISHQLDRTDYSRSPETEAGAIRRGIAFALAGYAEQNKESAEQADETVLRSLQNDLLNRKSQADIFASSTSDFTRRLFQVIESRAGYLTQFRLRDSRELAIPLPQDPYPSRTAQGIEGNIELKDAGLISLPVLPKSGERRYTTPMERVARMIYMMHILGNESTVAAEQEKRDSIVSEMLVAIHTFQAKEKIAPDCVPSSDRQLLHVLLNLEYSLYFFYFLGGDRRNSRDAFTMLWVLWTYEEWYKDWFRNNFPQKSDEWPHLALIRESWGLTGMWLMISALLVTAHPDSWWKDSAAGFAWLDGECSSL
jgi:hypothetical protein